MLVRILKNSITFTYLITDTETKQALLIDPAWDAATINSTLTDLDLQGIFLTHHHSDHVNLAEPFARKHNVPVFLTRAEIDYYDFRCYNLHALENEDAISLGAFSVQPWLTPGHTRGSSCYQLDCNLFTGDTVFIEGCGMCTLAGGDPVAMFASLQKLKNVISRIVKIYPGHSYGESPGKTFAHLLDYNIYFNINDCEKFVAFRMRAHQNGLFNFK